MRKKLMLPFTMALLAVFLTTTIAQAYSCPIQIWKSLYCNSSKPPYYTGHKYYFWFNITVHASQDFSSVIVSDRFGAELMIEGISVGTPKPHPFDYHFSYAPYAWNGDVTVTKSGDGSWTAKLNKEGIAFDGFHIYWTGNSVKVHFEWDIGPMSTCQRKTIFVIVSTDTNPAGHQEYTSCGWYYLNSGAVVKAVDEYGHQFSAETAGIQIYVGSE